ncbi:MAG TPA: SDR family oxidoreductase [Streptosporangiaceae bacterium]|nr:SDR family oxidoreductase [Streptosporangiaceae bacterium]
MTDSTAVAGTTAAADPAPARYGGYPDLAGKVAIITGGSRGIGAATAAALAANGASVAAVGRDEAALAAVTAGVRQRGGRAIGIAADCTAPGDLVRMAATVVSELGPPDILAAFAGGNGMPVPTAQETPEHWRDIIETDLNSVFYTVRAVLPAMTERASGAIILMSSAAARQAAKSAAAYAAAKAGVIAFGRHLAGELAPRGIRVNCVAPSATENDKMRAWMSPEQRAALGASFPLGRLGQPDDVAAAALFLASEASGWITGATLDIAGGKIML